VDFGTQEIILGDSIIQGQCSVQCSTLYPVQISINKRHTALFSTLYVLNSGEHHRHPPSTNSSGRVPRSPVTYTCD